ncbi:2Fe-2S iron-sulfur cluster-binding protein [Formosa sp. PL04]|uniref:2Fe-2S iron-sulfur cluster-binding protein n=1 Tax=Formosa sp. PL04 TaxID=3081755 RepID=UPI002980C973|nr:2Fe-2S iron-sulfur cluster-binding protein [Formosa sp. PL04]MDW5289900.1 2Fe-2S iron-sulfur cluster-binding protein [Formosa sp. PL04]
MYKIHLEDSDGHLSTFTFRPNGDENLMTFIVDNLAEDIGDCKGRAWCGTCMVKQINGNYDDTIIPDEQLLLDAFPDIPNIRLSCQIFLNPKLDGTTWKVLDSRQFM